MGRGVMLGILAFGMWATAAAAATVAPGADRLSEPAFSKLFDGKKLGVLAHSASRLAGGTHLVDYLHSHYRLRAIFAPEHGFRGKADEPVGDSRDEATGLPVYSLYGPRRAPTQAQLAALDAVVVDLQDVGIRFYTYPATVGLLLKACAQAHKPVILLDRPNPLGLSVVEGAVLEKRWAGRMTAFYPTTMLHGMTLGELARLYNEQLAIHADLTVVPVAGLTRSTSWNETGLEWRAPSPALTSAEQALLYDTFGTLETFNIAVGRGADNSQAFRVFGAPWITAGQAQRLASVLEAAKLPGLRFRAVQWVPTRREFEGKLCRGFHVELADARVLEPFRSLVTAIRAMRAVLGPRLAENGIDVALGAAWVRSSIDRGVPVKSILGRARAEAAPFLRERARASLY
ncbi:MAG: DUF1343 domain-containing protein [Deltaproteobacteria bacterium]|nr:DUF1343 domain-containing protein [Deltaproteobacteria bacterium]